MLGADDFERRGEGWSGSIGGMVPVQGEGTVDGHPWYFRARGDHWEMVIADPCDADPVDVYGGGVAGWFARESWGTWPEAGYMPLQTAWAFAEATIMRFRAGTLERVEQKPQPAR